jgi:hypothetical protein
MFVRINNKKTCYVSCMPETEAVLYKVSWETQKLK